MIKRLKKNIIFSVNSMLMPDWKQWKTKLE